MSYGELRIKPSNATPATLLAHDEFEQEEGSLSGKSLPLGGTWASTGDSGDFKITAGFAVRTAKEDSGNGRFALAGSEEPTSAKVSVTVPPLSNLYEELTRGVVLRYVSTTKFLAAVASLDIHGNPGFVVALHSAGPTQALGPLTLPQDRERRYVISLQATSDGSWSAWCYPEGQAEPAAMLSGWHPLLATGGEMAKGKAGFVDEYGGSNSGFERSYDNFNLFTGIPTDAAVYANRSLEVRSDRAAREDEGGTTWDPRSDYKGSYFRVPPSRREGRKVQTIVKLSRGPGELDPAIDDASFKIYWQARGLVLPES